MIWAGDEAFDIIVLSFPSLIQASNDSRGCGRQATQGSPQSQGPAAPRRTPTRSPATRNATLAGGVNLVPSPTARPLGSLGSAALGSAAHGLLPPQGPPYSSSHGNGNYAGADRAYASGGSYGVGAAAQASNSNYAGADGGYGYGVRGGPALPAGRGFRNALPAGNPNAADGSTRVPWGSAGGQNQNPNLLAGPGPAQWGTAYPAGPAHSDVGGYNAIRNPAANGYNPATGVSAGPSGGAGGGNAAVGGGFGASVAGANARGGSADRARYSGDAPAHGQGSGVLGGSAAGSFGVPDDPLGGVADARNPSRQGGAMDPAQELCAPSMLHVCFWRIALLCLWEERGELGVLHVRVRVRVCACARTQVQEFRKVVFF
jgi:hypothetical protein